MMKGSTGSLGGKWKLHLIGAKPRCVFQGAASRIELTATRPIDDGTWHRIVCSRNGKLHQLLVDGKVKASSTKAYSGKNVSAQPVKIGGRAVGSNGMAVRCAKVCRGLGAKGDRMRSAAAVSLTRSAREAA